VGGGSRKYDYNGPLLHKFSDRRTDGGSLVDDNLMQILFVDEHIILL